MAQVDHLGVKCLKRLRINKVREVIAGAFRKHAHSINSPDLKKALQQTGCRMSLKR